MSTTASSPSASETSAAPVAGPVAVVTGASSGIPRRCDVEPVWSCSPLLYREAWNHRQAIT